MNNRLDFNSPDVMCFLFNIPLVALICLLLKDKLEIDSPAIILLFAICTVELIFGLILGNTLKELLFSCYKTSFLDLMQYPRLILHVFGHSGIEHYTSNMMVILLVGPTLESIYTTTNIIIVILVVALVTGLYSITVHPDYAVKGASGVAFAFIIMTAFSGLTEGTKIPISAILVIAFNITREVYSALTTLDDGIGHGVHVLGGIVGGICGLVLNGVLKI